MYDNEKIKLIFSIENCTLQIKLDILDVYLDYRRGARIICRLDSQVELVVKELINLDIKVSVGKGLVFQNKGVNNVVDYFESKNLDSEKMIPLYISQKEQYAIDLREADETKDDIKFGEMLDYPECCVEKVATAGHVPSVIEAFHYLNSSEKYNVWTWPVAMIGDASLLVHYPCSHFCKKSIQLAQKHFHLIKQYAPKSILDRVIKHHISYYSLNNDFITINEKSGKVRPLNNLYEVS